MLHLLHPALSRAAALEPHRLRQQVLAVSAGLIAAGLLASHGVGTAIAVASESAAEEAQPLAQSFAASSVAAAPLDVIEFTVDERAPLQYPVGANAPVGSGFGPRAAACGACSTNHTGVDWNPAYGTPIIAVADGVVSKVVTSGSTLGVYITIDHVIDGQAITSVYGHMVSGSVTHAVGDEVRVGDQIGQVGSTGVTTAPHLHFELRIGGTPINPVPWMAARGAV